MPWLTLLKHRQTWAFFIGKFLTDPIWWFYLYWLPKFLDAGFGVTLTGLTLPIIAIYVVADFGSVGGGWVSSALIKRGWSVNRGRKTAMLIAALLIVPGGHLWQRGEPVLEGGHGRPVLPVEGDECDHLRPVAHRRRIEPGVESRDHLVPFQGAQPPQTRA